MTNRQATLREQTEHYNTIARYLAMRDVAELTPDALLGAIGVPKVELLIVLGNSVPFITEQAAWACRSGVAERLMIAGGIGHATPHLVGALARHPVYGSIPTNGRSEAEMLRDIVVRFAGLREEDIILETLSTNCGNNASFALRTLRSQRLPMPRSILLMQDPTMQRRTDASFRKAWSDAGETAAFVNFAAFVPELAAVPGAPDGIAIRAVGAADVAERLGGAGSPWELERYRSLVMGEVPRLRDDEYGYGPRGRGYIVHVDVPADVLAAFDALHALDPSRVRSIL